MSIWDPIEGQVFNDPDSGVAPGTILNAQGQWVAPNLKKKGGKYFSEAGSPDDYLKINNGQLSPILGKAMESGDLFQGPDGKWYGSTNWADEAFNALGGSNHGWLDKFLTKMPFTLGAAITGGALGGAFPGVDAAGTAIPAGQTGALSQFLSQPGAPVTESQWNYTGADQPWGVNPQAEPGVFDTAYQDYGMSQPYSGDIKSLSQLVNPQYAQSIPGMSSAAGAAALPGVAQYVPAGLSAAASGASVWDKLFTPSNLVNAATSLGTAALSAGAINKAVGAQTDATGQANALTAAMYDQNRADLEPWRTAGGGAVKRLSDMLQPGYKFDSSTDPGYDFRMGEGQKLLERSAAARGNLYSGGTGRALTRYGQDYASNEFNNSTNRLAALAGLGQTATNSTVAAGVNSANQQAQNTVGAGDARASGYVGAANAIGGTLANFLRNYQQQPFIDALTTNLARAR